MVTALRLRALDLDLTALRLGQEAEAAVTPRSNAIDAETYFDRKGHE